MSKRYTYEEVKNYFNQHGCKLLSTTYVNVNTKISYICSCGRTTKTTFKSFLANKHHCKNCRSNHLKCTYEEVKSRFTKHGCELLSTEYINSNSILVYRCKCGKISKTTLRGFKKCCRECGQRHGQETNKKNHGGILYFQTKEYIEKR